MDPRMSAAALGTGAVVVVAAGLGVSIVRTDDAGVRPTAGSASSAPSASPTTSPTPSPTPRPSVSPSPSPTPSATTAADDGRTGDDATGGHSRGSDRRGSGQGTAHGGSRQPTPAELPFTGSGPLPATTALGLLLAVAGSWTLVRVPGTPGELPVVVTADALGRLRAPRRVDR